MKVLQPVLKLVLLALAPFFLFGCAVGNQYMYKTENVGLPLKDREDTTAIGVAAKDSRPYILNGKKPATFVGLQRGGFGNPFNVTTASNRPFAADCADILAGMLGRYGYQVELKQNDGDLNTFSGKLKGADVTRGVFLNIKEWKTDIYASVTLHYDLELLILDGEGATLARSSQVGTEPIGGWTISDSSNGGKASHYFAIKLSYLFNDPKIKAALED